MLDMEEVYKWLSNDFVMRFVGDNPWVIATMLAIVMAAGVKIIHDVLMSVVDIVKAPFALIASIFGGVYTMVMVIFRGWKPKDSMCCVEDAGQSGDLVD